MLAGILLLAFMHVTFADEMAPVKSAQAADHVKVRTVSWEGSSTRVANARLAALKENLLHKTLDRAQLEQILADLTMELRNGGLMIAQVIMTPASRTAFFSTGELYLNVFEGKIGAIDLINTSLVDTTRLQQVSEKALCPEGIGNDCILTAQKMERATQLLQDITGVKLERPQLSPKGVAVGQTRVEITVAKNIERYSGSVSADNNGVGSTGKNRLGVVGAMNNVLGQGDVLNLGFNTTSRQQNSGLIGFKVPLGSDGWRGTSSLSRSLFSVSAVNSDGRADTATLGLAYPLLRGLERNSMLALDGVATHSLVNTLGVKVSDKQLYSLRGSLDFNSGDRALQLGQSFWSGNMALSLGSVADHTATGNPANQLGSYQKLGFNLLRRQNFDNSGNAYGLLSLRGQLASRNLDPSEKISLGGLSGVRAFRNDEGSLDDGMIVTMELRHRTILSSGDMFAPGIFIDYANGNINHQTYSNWQIQSGYSSSSISNHRSLSAFGMALDWLSPTRLSGTLVWAKRMPGSADSINYPGSATSRIWLVLGYGF
ncbi:ShlB/FhaC/HecB family hemolysin secretion/activation protein [Herbaspirillum sp. RTI4]|uniref:ShlB/FhaC/HecB family hemolysin secretion/activation protein n=1 Tax=Herbaspirillum sp. RTI4 TaxID=3048640 RepID=UPI002AB42AD5|nr:ShlB/FhaC/HecB family hemolysin secretion/activation protein [Herbaspirillum sp. RTI4]MDY7576935.1 ShlB/FhaC/HecB family hemolysin secretion/activation protein [Herbaspirillum sp. RTI4]MEA9983552.1 ShlB/FhaC/HecB family hemolysin secretion/activation protein [Herbaspirillum sp. RTI4]